MLPREVDVSCDNIESVVTMAVTCRFSHLKPLFSIDLHYECVHFKQRMISSSAAGTAALVLIHSIHSFK